LISASVFTAAQGSFKDLRVATRFAISEAPADIGVQCCLIGRPPRPDEETGRHLDLPRPTESDSTGASASRI
jgi:hypothetical protein